MLNPFSLHSATPARAPALAVQILSLQMFEAETAHVEKSPHAKTVQFRADS
jgi:hypothetical protein